VFWGAAGPGGRRDLCRGAARSAALRGGPAGRRSQVPVTGDLRSTSGRGRQRPLPVGTPMVADVLWILRHACCPASKTCQPSLPLVNALGYAASNTFAVDFWDGRDYPRTMAAHVPTVQLDQICGRGTLSAGRAWTKPAIFRLGFVHGLDIHRPTSITLVQAALYRHHLWSGSAWC